MDQERFPQVLEKACSVHAPPMGSRGLGLIAQRAACRQALSDHACLLGEVLEEEGGWKSLVR